MSDELSRGSEWARWDLHVHSPASFFWKGGKKLLSMNDDEKNEAIEKFIKTVNDSDVELFAVQDYWTFDWIIELRKYTETNKDALKKKVLIGMELRIECSADYRLNIHVLLSDELTNQQLQDFKSKLQIRIGTEDRALSNEALIEFAKKLDASKAKHHGYADPTTLDNEKLLELGSMTAEVSRDSLKNARGCLPKNSCFILLPYDTSDGLLNLDWAAHPQDDIYFMQSAHIFESRDQRNIDLINGKKTNENDTFFDNFFKTLGSIPKPCTAGSDAHKFEEYGIYPSSKATWIKAKPSFKGLEQTIYEPTDRVRIQELKPEEKSPQAVIDYVEYSTNANETKKVNLNQNLNSLIGSRAQGKSNLLRNMAYSIDNEQCDRRGVTASDFLPLMNFKVVWKDGTTSTLNTEEEKSKGVLFVPQKYLGELIYDKNPDFDKFLISLFENNTGFKNGLSVYKKFEDSNSLDISSLMQTLVDTLKQGTEKSESIKKLGNKESYDAEIKSIQERIKQYGQSVQISDTELKDYNQLNTDIKQIENSAKTIFQDIESLNTLKAQDVITAENIEGFYFSEKTFKKISAQLLLTDKEFKDNFIAKELVELNATAKKLELELKGLSTKIKPLDEKIKKSQALVSLTKLVEDKKIAKAKIETLGKERAVLAEKYKTTKELILKKYLKYEQEYGAITIESSNLEFSEVKIVVAFNKDSFRKFLDENINYHYSTDFKKEVSPAKEMLDDPSSWNYDSANFESVLRGILDGLLNRKLLVKSGKDLESVLSELLRNRYKIDFLQSVKRDGVQFVDMSDGEQMLALLEYIFKFDDYNYPVLLDQPEDDLDAKAISSTIVNFIKSEKAGRQIIIASHNANLVVCSDSENIIVSNKVGGSTSPDFHYTSGAIEEDDLNKEIVEILEGGEKAFEKRRNKLGIY